MVGRWLLVLLLLWPAGSNAQTVSGSLRARIENWNWFDTPAADGSYTYVGVLARAALSDQKDKFGWRVEAAVPALLGLPDDAIGPPPIGQLGAGASYWQASDSAENTASIFLKQAFVRFGPKPGEPGHSVRAGRFEFIDGTELTAKNSTIAALKRDRIAHRLIGNFGWTHVQRSYDGLHYAYNKPHLNVTVMGARPTRGVFDVAGMENLEVGLAYASFNGPSKGDVADWRLFVINYQDYRDDPRPVKVDNRPATARAADADNVQVNTLGAHYLRTLGSFDVLFWGALQNGDWGVLDHGAYSFSVEAGWQPSMLKSVKPWLRVGYFMASGDGNAADDDHETFFQVTPTPRIYARFPFYTLMNLQDLFASIMLRPSPRWTVRADAHHLQLTEPADLWYAGGGAFEPETFGYAGRPGVATGLASTLDLSVDFRMNDRISINGYVGWASGGDVIERIYQGNSASLAYLEVELRK
jgi:hypothetical protein